jgi:alkylation response protein AidB-like acyl-CoA dehydrogenase
VPLDERVADGAAVEPTWNGLTTTGDPRWHHSYQQLQQLTALQATDQSAMDLWAAIHMGLTGQQVANDLGGDRWGRLVDEAVDMFRAHQRAAIGRYTMGTTVQTPLDDLDHVIRGRADDINLERGLPDDVLTAVRASGLNRMAIPAELGGDARLPHQHGSPAYGDQRGELSDEAALAHSPASVDASSSASSSRPRPTRGRTSPLLLTNT